MLLVSIILIPIWCIVVTLYGMTLYSFSVSGEFDTIMILLPLVLNIILSYAIPYTIVNGIKEKKSPRLFEIEDKLISLGGYVSFIYLLLFGISLLLNGIIVKSNFIYIIAGVAIILTFIYITIECIRKESNTLEVVSIEALNENVFLVNMINDKNEVYEYYTTDDKFKVKSKYDVKSNKLLKRVISVDKNKKGDKDE